MIAAIAISLTLKFPQQTKAQQSDVVELLGTQPDLLYQWKQVNKPTSINSLQPTFEDLYSTFVKRTSRRRGIPMGSRSTQSNLENLYNTFVKRKRTGVIGGSRSNSICIISPGVLEEINIIWTNLPVFIWKTAFNSVEVQRITVLQAETGEILWQKVIPSSVEAILYDGAPLEPGKTYSWEIRWRFWNTQKNQWEDNETVHSFQIMDAPARKQLLIELEQLKTVSSLTKMANEQWVIRKAQYLADQGLLSDSLSILFALKEPSHKLKTTLAEITDFICVDKGANH